MANSIMDHADFPTFIDAAYSMVKEQELADTTDMVGEIFDVVEGDRYEEKITSLGEMGSWPELGGDIEAQEMYEQYETRARPREFATMTIITRRMVDDDQFGVLNGRRFRPMVRAGVVTRQEHATRPFENINVLDQHFYTFSEAVPIASASHGTQTPDVSTATGFSNIIVDVLSPVSVRAAQIQGRKIKSDQGKRANIFYDKVYVPVDLVPRMVEILHTLQGLDTPFQNVNPESNARSTIQRIVGLPYWSTTNRWVLANSRLERMNQKWIERVSPEYGRMTEFHTLQIKSRGYMRYGYYFSGWRQWLCGVPA